MEKSLTARKWEIEEHHVMEYLDLPNDLHPDTPTTGGKAKVIHDKATASSKALPQTSHAVLCRDQLTFTDQGCAYMEGQLALMELDLTEQANNQTHEQYQFIVSGAK